MFERTYYEAESFWADEAVADPANLRRVADTAALVPAVASLLDAGCGNGVFVAELRRSRPDLRVVGLDRSATALGHVPAWRVRGDLSLLPFDDEAFDCVTCLEVIEHLPVPAYARAIAELARVARRYVLIGVPYREAIENNVTTCPECRTTFNIDLHLRTFDDDALAGLLPGFRLVESTYPGRGEKLRGLSSVLEMRDRLRNRGGGFRSPICPVCGYTEGDRTALSLRPAEGPPGQQGSPNPIRRVLTSVVSRWPRVEVSGYWVAALYER